jgi:WD40 repeat protein
MSGDVDAFAAAFDGAAQPSGSAAPADGKAFDAKASASAAKEATEAAFGGELFDDDYVEDPRERLQELFREVYGIVDALVDENHELRARLRQYEPSAMPLGHASGAALAPGSGKIAGAKARLAGKNLLKLKVGRFATSLSQQKEEPYAFVRAYEAHKDGVLSLDSCVWNDNLFVSTSADRTARVWYADGSFASVVYAGHRGAVNSARFHPNARLVCTAGGDAVCHVWLVPAFRHQPQAVQPTPSKAASRAASAALSRTSPVHVRDEQDGTLSPPRRGGGSSSGAGGAAGAGGAGGSGGAGSGGGGGGMNISLGSGMPSTPPSHHDSYMSESIDVEDERTASATAAAAATTTLRQPRLELVGHTSAVMGVDWLRRGAALASADRRGLVVAWDANTGRAISKTTVPSSYVSESGAVLAPNAAAGSASAQAASLLFPQGAVRPLVTSVIGGGEQPLFAVSTTLGDVFMWDMRSMDTPAVVLRAHEHAACNSSDFVALDDNLFVSSGDDRAVKLWDLRHTSAAKTTMRCGAAPARVCVSNQTGLVAVPSEDKRTRVFDLTGAKRAKMRSEDKLGHRAAVTCAAWSNDESVLFSGSWDRSVQAWSSASATSSVVGAPQ